MKPSPDHEVSEGDTIRGFEDLRVMGLLWLINTSVFHPRGFALAFHYPEGATLEEIEAHEVEPIGWSLAGDGSEAWRFEGAELIDQAFQAAEAFFGSAFLSAGARGSVQAPADESSNDR